MTTNTPKTKTGHGQKIKGVHLLMAHDIVEMSGYSLLWVRICLRSGKLESTKIGNQYFVTMEQYNKWVNAKKPRGRPAKRKLPK
jgi:hypothetical protein